MIAAAEAKGAPNCATGAELILVQAGLSHVTDLGRNAAHLGFSNHGALDEHAARVANCLVGNGDNAPLIENAYLRLQIEVTHDTVVAVTGAATELRIGDRPAAAWAPHHAAAGESVTVDVAEFGVRTYVAFLGGVSVPAVLGSVAPDPVLAVGGALADGDRLQLYAAVRANGHPFGIPVLRVHGPLCLRSPGPLMVPITEGPDVADFTGGVNGLLRNTFRISQQSDAVGLRMSGPAPTSDVAGEVQSVAVPIGAVEVPGPDELIVLHRGRGVTAGYRVPAVVTRHGLDLLAQAAPGRDVRFIKITERHAIENYRRARSSVQALAVRARRIIGAQFAVDTDIRG